MLRAISFLVLSVMSSSAFAGSAEVNWYSRGTYVICGGMVDGETLNVRVSVPNEVLAAESPDHRALIFIDLHKPAQVRWMISDGMSDEDYEKREAIVAKLPADEAQLIRKISENRVTDLYSGMTNGFVTLKTSTKSGRSVDLSCQELPAPGGVVTE